MPRSLIVLDIAQKIKYPLRVTSLNVTKSASEGLETNCLKQK